MSSGKYDTLLENIVECDEVHLGGKNKNRHKKKTIFSGVQEKIPIFTYCIFSNFYLTRVKPFSLFAAALWRLGYLIDSKTRLIPKKNVKFNTPLIGVGSLLAGGAGKTPYTAFLAEKLKTQGFSVGILCKNTGDENLWFKKKGFDVFTENRFELCRKLDGKFDVLISDDGLEDRRLSHAFWICLTWDENARNLRDIIPHGNCRSLWKDHPEIACVKRCAMEWEDAAKTADIVFSMEAALPKNSKIIALAGIARSHRFFEGLRRKYAIEKKIKCRDHSKNIQKKIIEALKFGLPVVITEKDSVKLNENILQNKNIFVATLSILPQTPSQPNLQAQRSAE